MANEKAKNTAWFLMMCIFLFVDGCKYNENHINECIERLEISLPGTLNVRTLENGRGVRIIMVSGIRSSKEKADVLASFKRIVVSNLQGDEKIVLHLLTRYVVRDGNELETDVDIESGWYEFCSGE
jgi:hypothetical protein